MFICVAKNPDGSHAFQIGGNQEPGWAAVPEDMKLPDSFPFVNIETAMVTHPAVTVTVGNGKVNVIEPEYTWLEVTSMTDGEEIPVEIPAEEPTPEERLESVEQRTADLESGNAEILEALDMLLSGVTE